MDGNNANDDAMKPSTIPSWWPSSIPSVYPSGVPSLHPSSLLSLHPNSDDIDGNNTDNGNNGNNGNNNKKRKNKKTTGTIPTELGKLDKWKYVVFGKTIELVQLACFQSSRYVI